MYISGFRFITILSLIFISEAYAWNWFQSGKEDPTPGFAASLEEHNEPIQQEEDALETFRNFTHQLQRGIDLLQGLLEVYARMEEVGTPEAEDEETVDLTLKESPQHGMNPENGMEMDGIRGMEKSLQDNICESNKVFSRWLRKCVPKSSFLAKIG